MALKAKDIMTKVVVTAKRTTPLDELVRIMLERRITGIPIVDDGSKLVGIVAQDDIIFKSRDLSKEEAGERMKPPDKDDPKGILHIIRGGFVTFSDKTKSIPTVERVMTRNVHSATEETNMRDLAALMWDKRVHRIPICDAEGVLTGIVSSIDICRVVSEGSLTEAE